MKHLSWVVNNRGMTLVEVMVYLGVAGISALALAHVATTMQKSISSVEGSVRDKEIGQELFYQLEKSESCKQNLSQQSGRFPASIETAEEKPFEISDKEKEDIAQFLRLWTGRLLDATVSSAFIDMLEVTDAYINTRSAAAIEQDPFVAKIASDSPNALLGIFLMQTQMAAAKYINPYSRKMSEPKKYLGTYNNLLAEKFRVGSNYERAIKDADQKISAAAPPGLNPLAVVNFNDAWSVGPRENPDDASSPPNSPTAGSDYLKSKVSFKVKVGNRSLQVFVDEMVDVTRSEHLSAQKKHLYLGKISYGTDQRTAMPLTYGYFQIAADGSLESCYVNPNTEESCNVYGGTYDTAQDRCSYSIIKKNI